jgi:hypothetical protein
MGTPAPGAAVSSAKTKPHLFSFAAGVAVDDDPVSRTISSSLAARLRGIRVVDSGGGGI